MWLSTNFQTSSSAIEDFLLLFNHHIVRVSQDGAFKWTSLGAQDYENRQVRNVALIRAYIQIAADIYGVDLASQRRLPLSNRNFLSLHNQHPRYPNTPHSQSAYMPKISLLIRSPSSSRTGHQTRAAGSPLLLAPLPQLKPIHLDMTAPNSPHLESVEPFLSKVVLPSPLHYVPT